MVIHLPVLIRPLAEPDLDYLERALANSIHEPEGGDGGTPASRSAPSKGAGSGTPPTSDPVLRRAVETWGREGDIGVVAEAGRGRTSRLVGAAWLRRYSEREPFYGYVNDMTPALVISVEPGYRGLGIGSELLRALFEATRDAGVKRVSLSVDPRNPARRLYERFGFRKTSAPRLIDGDAHPVLVLDLT